MDSPASTVSKGRDARILELLSLCQHATGCTRSATPTMNEAARCLTCEAVWWTQFHEILCRRDFTERQHAGFARALYVRIRQHEAMIESLSLEDIETEATWQERARTAEVSAIAAWEAAYTLSTIGAP